MRLTLEPLRRRGILIFKTTFVQFLCSHLVRIRPKSSQDSSETALLEEIEPSAVVLVSSQSHPKGCELVLATDGFEADLEVVECASRDDSFVIRAIFAAGRRWNPREWSPAHLFELKPKANAAGAS